MVSASTREKSIGDSLPGKKDTKESAKIVGTHIGTRAKEKGINQVVYDRAGYKYHGRAASLADAAREVGLQF